MYKSLSDLQRECNQKEVFGRLSTDESEDNLDRPGNLKFDLGYQV